MPKKPLTGANTVAVVVVSVAAVVAASVAAVWLHSRFLTVSCFALWDVVLRRMLYAASVVAGRVPQSGRPGLWPQKAFVVRVWKPERP